MEAECFFGALIGIADNCSGFCLMFYMLLVGRVGWGLLSHKTLDHAPGVMVALHTLQRP